VLFEQRIETGLRQLVVIMSFVISL